MHKEEKVYVFSFLRPFPLYGEYVNIYLKTKKVLLKSNDYVKQSLTPAGLL